MNYIVRFACVSHVGKVRKINQDNVVCAGAYFDTNSKNKTMTIADLAFTNEAPLFGVFDGLGGEEQGEVAALIAAKYASKFKGASNYNLNLANMCHQINTEICDYASKNGVSSMGTTAAILQFKRSKVFLCNIGDSKIFRIAHGRIEQLSKDHIDFSSQGVKPPLLQILGIPPVEFDIDPYLAHGQCSVGDLYLICTDGLTDMISADEIAHIIESKTAMEACNDLVYTALLNGGRDNVTVILCIIERKPTFILKRNLAQYKESCKYGK